MMKTGTHEAYEPIHEIRERVRAGRRARGSSSEHVAQEVHRDVEPTLLHTYVAET